MSLARGTFLAAGILAMGASCTRPTAAGSDKSAIALKGSDTMVILGQRWAEEFMSQNPGLVVQVTGGGTGTGIAALINGSTDICQASRPMKETEKASVRARHGADAVETSVALDAIAVYVNDENPIRDIAIADLAKIYTGKMTSWRDLGAGEESIVIYGRENNSGTYGYFREHVLANADFAQGVQTLVGTSAVANAVKGDPRGIGYGGIAYLEGVRALSIRKDSTSAAVAPSLETARDGTYPLSRYLYFYTAGPAAGTTKRFIDWVVGAEGQRIIDEVGFYPLPQ